ncbi:MAG TPA: SHOCT domain-containing protein [Ktedonobacterales bacterium]
MMWGPYMYGTGMGWWMLVPTLFAIALLAVIVWAVARFTSPRRGDAAPRLEADLPPEEILRRRYARGEIDAQTFEVMRERLAADQPHRVAGPVA